MYDLTNNGNDRAVSRGGARASAAYAELPGDEQPFSPGDVGRIIRKRLWIIILVTLVFVGAALAFSRWQTPEYVASATLLVSQQEQQGDAAQPVNLSGNIEGLLQFSQTAVEAIDSSPVAEETSQRLGLQMDPGRLLNNLTVEQVGSTQFIDVVYRDTDPERAQEIANTISQVSTERVTQLSAGEVTATIWEDATAPDAPVSPEPERNAILALALGLMFGIGLAFLTEFLDDSWRSPEEVEQVSGIPTFGVIPRVKVPRNERSRRR